MSKDLIISVSDSEISIALLEDKQLVELNKEKRNVKFSVGDIYLGKVKKIMPGLNAAFINVGFEKDARFLHYPRSGSPVQDPSPLLCPGNAGQAKKGRRCQSSNLNLTSIKRVK
ncbi:MAG: hypothetical protein U5L72_10470 [Bacteroidales bacterium]|nr:hypothetical protein [Bacteroidales bacterium]